MLIFRSSRNCFSPHPRDHKNCTTQPTQSLRPYPPWLSNARRLCGKALARSVICILFSVSYTFGCVTVSYAPRSWWLCMSSGWHHLFIVKEHTIKEQFGGEIIYLCLYLENKAQSLSTLLQGLGGKGQACTGLFEQVGFMVISWYIVGEINHA